MSPVTSTGVIESAEYIARNADDVSVNVQACRQAADSIYEAMQVKKYSTESWSANELNPKDKTARTVDWIFVVDLLNFSFWSDADREDTGRDANRYTVKYNGQAYTGYWSLCAAINRALDEGIPVLSPAFWADAEKSPDELWAHVFRSDAAEQIPLLEDRVLCLRQAGRVLVDKHGGSYVNCVKKAAGSAVALVQLTVADFECFRDETAYKGRTVQIYKRPQILVSDIWACFNGTGYGAFDDIDALSMFADYRVPQILYRLGCLDYSAALAAHIWERQPLLAGDPWEVELRGCSIWAVEEIRRAMLEAHADARGRINAILIDFYLWDTAKEEQGARGARYVPCHRTRSIYY
ncbi:uncharacterized protein V1510DRAFT_934 [Dipodascopsis tothii]|uniref:uncharacterized protein n=1 Tax=Dipodascopsis tothii TaxID=44089 RepID=UPI0034CEB7A0